MASSERIALQKNAQHQRHPSKAAAARGKFVPARTLEHDSLYLAPVTIGGQKFNLDFDTGSSDLWIRSNRLPQAAQAGHNVFKPEDSPTFKKLEGSTWKIVYGDHSSASGDVGTDTVTLGRVRIQRQGIELATELSESWNKNPSDGLLGLALGKLNTVKPTPVKTPVENMITQGDIGKDAQLFTAYLGSYRDKNNPDHGESFYTFGSVDQDVVKASGGSINWVPVNASNGFWQVSSPSATIGGKSYDRTGNESIIDTGTTLAMVEDRFCEKIYSAIPGSRKDDSVGGYLFPASVPQSNLPTIQFAIGSKVFSILPEDLQYVKSGHEWFGGIQPRGRLPFDIYGDTFLKNIYAIFDQGNMRFGCVQRFELESAGGESESTPTLSWFNWFQQMIGSLLGSLSGWFGNN